jgi:multiple sugar transport system permease protein
MATTQPIIAAGHRPPRLPGWLPRSRPGLRGADLRWAVAFVVPYAAVFLLFVVYPFARAVWMARSPALYAELLDDPTYLMAVVNTLVFVGVAVNVKMFLALLLSGFFQRRRLWIKALLAVFILPWLIASAEACVSFHWMLTARWGLVDSVVAALSGVDGPAWLNTRWLALLANVIAYMWKWLPFWTVIFLAGRMTIARSLYDAAEIDGAGAVGRFVHVTLPLLANLYLICTLLSVLWTLGEFTTTFLVSSGGPADSTQVLATLGFDYAFQREKPALGVAVALSALPVLIPIVIVLLRRVQTREVQL